MKNQFILLFVCLLFAIITFTSCEKMMVGEIIETTPENNFQNMWDKFDSHYGLFLVKDINWDSVYALHLPLAKSAKTNEDLFKVLSSALSILKDQHVNIYTTNSNLADYNSGHNGHIPAQESFLFKTVRDNYLIEFHEESEDFGYGKLADNIGYIHASSYNDDLSVFKKAMDKAMNALASTKKIVFDVRDHSGGSDQVSKYIAGRFAKSRKIFMTSKKRNGPGHNDFESVVEWYMEPEGDFQYTKPVILLTTSRSISAAETFTFAMRQNDNIIHIGDTTAGAFSDVVPFHLPNGWLITISVGDYRGSDGKSYEGIGIAPHIYSKNLKADLLAGVDKTLIMAINL